MRAAGRTEGLNVAFWLASLSLLLRALLPGGVMLAPADRGWGATMVLCPGTMPMVNAAAVQHTRHADAEKPAPAPRGADPGTCLFAGLAAPHLAPAPAPEPFRRQWSATDPIEARPVGRSPAMGMPAPPPPSQGPPRAFA